MRIHADFTQRVVVRTEEIPWVASGTPGVERKMLDRIGGEVARATSLVRYAAGSAFAPHVHGGGEEIFVCEGVFSDEHGDYGAGTYIHNPVGSSHAPRSREGCVILVKLWQMSADDAARVVIDTKGRAFTPAHAAGFSVLRLHEHAGVRVSLLEFAPGAELPEHVHEHGEEFFVLDGSLTDELGTYAKGDWVRQPPGSRHRPRSVTGCSMWSKSGHLAEHELAFAPDRDVTKES